MQNRMVLGIKLNVFIVFETELLFIYFFNILIKKLHFLFLRNFFFEVSAVTSNHYHK